MSYETVRKLRQSRSEEKVSNANEIETERFPVLHSGFTTPSTRDPSKNTLSVLIYHNGKSYMCRIEDREDDLRCFVKVPGLVDLFELLEQLLAADDLDWSEQKPWGRNGAR